MKQTILALCLAFSLVGCGAKAGTTSSTPYGTAAKVALIITDSLNTGATLVNQLAASGTLSASEATTILNVFQSVNNLNTAFGACVAQVHAANGAASGYLACGQTFQAALNGTTLSGLHVSNPTAQADIQAIAAAVVGALNIALIQIQNPPVGTPAAPAIEK
jgi:hypothetical protein